MRGQLQRLGLVTRGGSGRQLQSVAHAPWLAHRHGRSLESVQLSRSQNADITPSRADRVHAFPYSRAFAIKADTCFGSI